MRSSSRSSTSTVEVEQTRARAGADPRGLAPLRARDVRAEPTSSPPPEAQRPRWPLRPRRRVDVLCAGSRRERAQGHRSQRPVLVRVGQEVQALPRRLTSARAFDPRRRVPLARGRARQPSRSTSACRRSGPSSPGSVITFDPDRLTGRAASSRRRWAPPGSGTTRPPRRASPRSTRDSPASSIATSGYKASTRTRASCSHSERTRARSLS